MAAQLFETGTPARPTARRGDEAMRRALDALGADPQGALSAEERQHLQERGYLLLEPVLTPAQCEEAKRRIHAQIAAEEAGEPFSVGSEGESALRLSNVFNTCNHDGLFDVAVTHPRVLACMRLMLGDAFKLSSLNVRGANPGAGLQGLHTDWGENLPALQTPPQYQVCNSIWLLDAFTEDNGGTSRGPLARPRSRARPRALLTTPLPCGHSDAGGPRLAPDRPHDGRPGGQHRAAAWRGHRPRRAGLCLHLLEPSLPRGHAQPHRCAANGDAWLLHAALLRPAGRPAGSPPPGDVRAALTDGARPRGHRGARCARLD